MDEKLKLQPKDPLLLKDHAMIHKEITARELDLFRRKAERFPTEVRALGVGLSYAIANALFGGTAEYVGLWFKSVGQEWLFPWYVTALCAVALIASLAMPDTRKRGYLEGSET